MKAQHGFDWYQSTVQIDNFKGFRICLGSLCLASWRKFGLKGFVVYLLPSSSNRFTNAFAVKGQDSSPLYQSTGKRDHFKGYRTCLVAVFGFALNAFLIGANLDTEVLAYTFYHHLRIDSRTNLPCKGKTVRLYIGRLYSEIISKAFVCVWDGLAFPVVANLDTKVLQYAFYHHLRIKSSFVVKGQDNSPLYQSTGQRDNFKGFRTCLRINSKIGGVMVLSAYQVGDKLDFDDNGQKGRKTTRLQQHSMLKEDIRIETPREAFRKDLIEFLLPAKNRGDSILIMGDFNEVFEGQSGMMDVADALGMVDLLDVKLGTQKFGTHVRNESEERIDYALGSPRLVLAIRQCGYEPFGRNYKGDHRGFYIDFDTNTLFGNELHELMSQEE